MPRRPRRDRAARGRRGPARVLLAHDDPDALELLRRVLSGAGHEVLPASSEDDALALVASEHPDAAVLDLGDNLRLVEVVRHHDDGAVAGVPVVMVSRHGDNRMFSWQSGIDGFLAHPFHAAELVAEVAAVLARPESERVPHRRAELQRARASGGRRG